MKTGYFVLSDKPALQGANVIFEHPLALEQFPWYVIVCDCVCASTEFVKLWENLMMLHHQLVTMITIITIWLAGYFSTLLESSTNNWYFAADIARLREYAWHCLSRGKDMIFFDAMNQ